MSAFNSVASSMETGVTSAFGVAAFDVAAHKPAVVAGIKASLNQSFGNDFGFKPTLGM